MFALNGSITVAAGQVLQIEQVRQKLSSLDLLLLVDRVQRVSVGSGSVMYPE